VVCCIYIGIRVSRIVQQTGHFCVTHCFGNCVTADKVRCTGLELSTKLKITKVCGKESDWETFKFYNLT
jgi:hypothetical protein